MSTVSVEFDNDLSQTRVHIRRRAAEDAVSEAIGLFVASLLPSVRRRVLSELNEQFPEPPAGADLAQTVARARDGEET